MTPTTEARILSELGDLKAQLQALVAIIHSTGDHAGLAEAQRMATVERGIMRAEIGDLWVAMEEARKDVRTLQQAPGKAALSMADRVLVALMIAMSLGLGTALGLVVRH